MVNVKERIKELENKYELDEIIYKFDGYNSGYICDIITEVCDNNIDIYNSNLWEWAKDNEYYIKEAVRNYGIDKNNFDLMRLFQLGQYYYYEELCYKYLDDIIEYLILSNITTNNDMIQDEVYDRILEIAKEEDNNAQLENYIEEINNLINEKE